jgi:hypothetical protein
VAEVIRRTRPGETPVPVCPLERRYAIILRRG